MKTKKWILPVCIVTGVVVLCLSALLVTAGVMSSKGYGISIGKLYFSDKATYLIDSDDKAMLVSDKSNDGDLFKKYSNGDKVLVIHDGVEESYPSRSGGYYAVRLSEGNGSYKPADEVLGVEILSDERSPLGVNVQYIRTDGYHDDVEYPAVKIIRAADELNAYYKENKDRYDLERKDKVYSDSTIGFLDACDKYDEAYFEDQILVMVLLEEGSGSNRHNVDNVKIGSDGKLYISIRRNVPETGTCDMAEWHILIEPEANIDVAHESDVVVYLDGVNPKTQPTTVRESGNFSNISLSIPYDWKYETEKGNNDGEYCIAFWPEDQTEGKLKLWYYTAFGVCGTGLEEKEIAIGEYKAWQGTYGNKKVWDFISFANMPGSYVVMNEGADKWWNQYGDEAMEILSTVKIAENIINEEQAIELAKKQTKADYDDASARFDTEKGIWTVTLSFKKASNGDGVHSYRITHEGKVLDVAYGD